MLSLDGHALQKRARGDLYIMKGTGSIAVIVLMKMGIVKHLGLLLNLRGRSHCKCFYRWARFVLGLTSTLRHAQHRQAQHKPFSTSCSAQEKAR
jgi:hypothetical protein